MSIRRKTRVRLVVLLSAFVLVGGSSTGGYYLWGLHKDTLALAELDPGMKAAKAGDYRAAMLHLGNYLGRFIDRSQERGTARYAEALFNYALARQMIDEPKKTNLVTAVALWKRYLDLLPNGPEAIEARHKLMEAEVQLGWGPEALDAAQTVLKGDPKDKTALEVKVAVLYGQHKLPEAMAAAKAWAAEEPHALAAHFWIERILAVQDPDHAAGQVLQYTEGLLAAKPDDPYFQILVSQALVQSIDVRDTPGAGAKATRAATLALEATAKDLPDATLTAAAVQQLDRLWTLSLALGKEAELKLIGKGLEVARRSAADHPDEVEFQRICALRLIEAGAYQDAVNLLTKVTPSDAEPDGTLLAFKALAEFSLGPTSKKEGAALLAAARKAAETDADLGALCDALDATWMSSGEAKTADELRVIAKDRLDKLKAAAAKAPSDVVVNYLLGQANVLCGNLEDAGNGSAKQDYYKAAETAFSAAVTGAPAWWQARAGLAQTLLFTRQWQAAVSNADLAQKMAPDDPAMLSFDTVVHALSTAPGQTAQVNQVVALADELQRRFSDKVTPADRQQIARQLSRLGRTDDAIRFLTPGTPGEAASRPAGETLLLANLYRDEKRYQDAQNLCDQLLAKQPTGDVILFAADLAGALGQKDKAEAILGRMDGMKTPPGLRDAIWAQYYQQYGTPQQAVASWKAALKAAPANAAAWRLMLGFCLKAGTSEQFDGIGSFLSLLKEARAAVPDDPAIAYLGGLQDAAGRKTEAATPSVLDELCQGQDSYTRPLIVALLGVQGGDAATVKGTTDALIKCVDALAGTQKTLDAMPEIDTASAKKAMDALLPELQAVADDNPGVMAIQNFLVGWYGLAAHYDQCVTMAIRTMQAFPANPELPARVAIPTLARLGRWADVIRVAREWRRYSLAAPEAADRALAEAFLNQRQYSDAIAQLNDPYLRDIAQKKKTPNDYFQVYALYLKILLNSDQSDQAIKAVTPLLGDRRWRVAWLGLADGLRDERMEAQCLGAVTAAIPADAGDEHGLLALAWDRLGTRTKNATYRTTAVNTFDALLNNPKTAEYAKSLIKQIIAAPQDSADALMLWAHWLFAKESLDAAMQAMEPLLQSPAGRLAWITVGYEVPDANAAARWFDRAADALRGVADSPSTTYQRFRLGWAWKDLAQQINQWKGQAVPAERTAAWRQNGVAILEPLAAQNPTNVTILRVLASTYEDASNLSAAADTYRKAVKIQPSDWQSLNNLASSLVKLKDKAAAGEAVDDIANAIKLATDPRLYDTQASVLAVLAGDYAGALDSIQKAIALEPGNPDWRAARVWIMALAGQRDRALAEFNLLKQDPNYSKLTDGSRQKLKDVGLQ